MFKSRTYRRIKVKTPKNRVVTHYKLKKPKKIVCKNCGINLKGTLQLRAKQHAMVSKSKKKTERAYSDLCSKCARKEIISKAIRSKINE